MNKLTHIQSVEPERVDIPTKVTIGDWYWVYSDFEMWSKKKQTHLQLGKYKMLYCVAHVGSNHVEFVRTSERGYETTIRIMFTEFSALCKKADGESILARRTKKIQQLVNKDVALLLDKAGQLHLMPSAENPQTNLPSTQIRNADKYKSDLAEAKASFLPVVDKRMEQRCKQLTVETSNLALPATLKMRKIRGLFENVEDKLFSLELYTGIHEQIVQLQQGIPAPAESPIKIRQLLLFMDEECLIDYDKGGMDIDSIEKFDAWLLKPENLNRILPEDRGVVAMRIRRNDKDYGVAKTLGDLFYQIEMRELNRITYLLFRNGENVYRLFTQLDFAPRLIPFENEFNHTENYLEIKHEYEYGERKKKLRQIGPADVEYDEYVLKEMTLLKNYNRIVLVLQGVIDRTSIFAPMPKISLSKTEDIQSYIHIIRDEEKTLEEKPVPFEEYVAQLNKSLRPGKLVYGAVKYMVKEYGSQYRSKRDCEPGWPSGKNYENFSEILKVDSLSRDRKEVQVSWPGGYVYGYVDERSYWVEGHQDTRRFHMWIPIEHLINISDYTPGDYKMFLCSRSARGAYLDWAPALLAAEDLHTNYVRFEKRWGKPI